MIVGCDQDHPPEAELPDALPSDQASSKAPRLSPAVTKPTPSGKSGNCFRYGRTRLAVGSRQAPSRLAARPLAAEITISTSRPSVRYLTTLFTVALKHPLFAPPPVCPTALVSAQLCLRQLKTIYMPSEWYLPVHTGFLFHKDALHNNLSNLL